MMKLVLVLCTLSLSSLTAFQFGSVPFRRSIYPTGTTSTRRWALKEPSSQIEAENKVEEPKSETKVKSEENAVVEEMDVAMSHLSPSEDEEELSRDEHFMKLAAELAEEE